MDIKYFLDETWRMLMGRVQGPMTFRLFVQPLVASIFAIRAGLKDSREHRGPFIEALWFKYHPRRDLLREAWKDVGKVFLVAVVLDVVYQIIELRWVYPGQAVIVAGILAIAPYVLLRGPVNRLTASLRKAGHSRQANQGAVSTKPEKP